MPKVEAESKTWRGFCVSFLSEILWPLSDITFPWPLLLTFYEFPKKWERYKGGMGITYFYYYYYFLLKRQRHYLMELTSTFFEYVGVCGPAFILLLYQWCRGHRHYLMELWNTFFFYCDGKFSRWQNVFEATCKKSII